ncbi:hypothetical protein HDV01_004166 [Terramyces sp. JEL0728]|nr:hypothetical protein HDV01_004166 [Terramyces sp. JEL0728]
MLFEIPEDDDDGYLSQQVSFKNLNHNTPTNVDLLPKVVQLNSFSTDVNREDTADAIEPAENRQSTNTVQNNYRVSIDHSTQTDYEPRYSLDSNDPQSSVETNISLYQDAYRNSIQPEHGRFEVQPFISEIESLIGSISGRSNTDVMTTLYRHSTRNNSGGNRNEFNIDQVSLD